MLELATSPANVMIRDELILVFEEFIAAQDVKDSSKATYRRNLTAFQIYLLSHQITRPAEQDILNYKNYLLVKGLSVLTINNCLAVLKLFFNFLHQNEYYQDIAKNVKLLRRSREFYRDALSVDQVKDLIAVIDCDSIKGLRDYAIINLLVRTGLRVREVSLIDNQDMYKQADATVLRVQSKGHNAKDEIVVLTHNAMKPILAYQAIDPALDPAEPMFTSLSNNSVGQRIDSRSISRMIRAYFREAGILSRRITPHSLRHTAITFALKGGATLQEAQAMARHQSINTTMIYAHNLDRLGNAAEFKIDNILGAEGKEVDNDD